MAARGIGAAARDLDGAGSGGAGFGNGGAWARDLRAHCVAFCSALTRHHTGEDGGAFPELARRFPQLRPVLDELERDHRMVDELLHRIEDLVGPAVTGVAAPSAVRAELDGLAALLESHFTYEERRLVGALNAVDLPAWTVVTPDFLRVGAEPGEPGRARRPSG